jgi:hypothetical protein
MSDLGEVFMKLFEKPEMEVRNCENCNSGIITSNGIVCCIDKKQECLPNGSYKYWTPLVVIGEEDLEDEA